MAEQSFNGSNNFANHIAPQSEIPFASIPQRDGGTILRYVLAGVSVPLNIVVIIVISCSRQLHAPRHVYWVGISTIFLFISLELLIESFIRRNTIICALYELSMGIWHPSLLLFLSLAGWDRYAAIKYYEWYRNRMTNLKAASAMLIAWLSNTIVVESPYWTGFKSLSNCSVNKAHAFWIFLWYLSLSLINIALQVQIFIASRKVIRDYPAHYRGSIVFSSGSIAYVSKRSRRESTSDTIYAPVRRANQLDFRAALTMSVNVLPFWLFTLPIAVNVVAFYWCTRLELACPTDLMMTLHGYFKILFFLPSIYMPLMYMLSCSEFRRAFRRQLGKTKSSLSAQTSLHGAGGKLFNR